MSRFDDLRRMREQQWQEPTEAMRTSEPGQSVVDVEAKPSTSGSSAVGTATPIVRSVGRRGRPLGSQRHMTNEAQKPWEAEGMSRATWYNRRRKTQSGTTMPSEIPPIKSRLSELMDKLERK